MSKRDRHVEETDDGLTVQPPADHAVGMAATVSIAKRSTRELRPIRTARLLSRINQPGGFDCPGCAWPEPDEKHQLEFCENGVKAISEEATRRTVGADFFARHSIAELLGRTEHWLSQQGRLAEPMLLSEGASHYQPISWDDAFKVIGEELQALDTPDEALFYTSGRTSNEAAFLYQLFARAFGTNNLPDCSNMCHESSGSALTETIGIGKGTVTINDVASAELIIVAGQNPGTNHPRMLTTLEQAKQRGAKIITINPLPEAGLQRFDNPQTLKGLTGRGTQLTDLFLQVKLGGDLWLFKGLMRLLLDAEAQAPGTVVDQEFVNSCTVGLPELQDSLKDVDWAEIERESGVGREQLQEAADLLVASKKTIVCWAMGLTQHRESVATIREVVNLLLLQGNIGKNGAGLCPVRGHSNVQGDRTMGIWEKPEASFLQRLDAAFGIKSPREHGLDVVDSIRALRDGKAKVFVAMGGNFAAASPDTELTEKALGNASLTVQISTKLNRSHLIHGRRALILPTLGRTDKDIQQSGPQQVSVEDSMSVVHSSQGRLKPPSDSLQSEVAIVCGIARATFGDAPSENSGTSAAAAIPWEELQADYSNIRDKIEQVIDGFEKFNERLRWPGGFVLPQGPRDHRRFDTESGKAHFTVNEIEPQQVPEGRLLLQTLRSHDQYNTTIYGLDDRYRGIHGGRRVVLVHPDDCSDLGLSDGQQVDIISEWTDGSQRRASEFRIVHYPTARGCAAAYYPETNSLVPLDSTAKTSNTPTSKSVIVRLQPS